MISDVVAIRELAGWGFDSYDYRPDELEANAQPSSFVQSNVVLAQETERLRDQFECCAKRPDLLSEMDGLSWSLGVVDLRSLIAFQRRLALSSEGSRITIPAADDWHALLELSFGLPKTVEYEAFHDRVTGIFTMRSNNPNLHLRFTKDPVHPLSVHAGCPFFEVARFRNRWFLRDGYHRAYALLQANVFAVPAVIVEAKTLDELGADQPWFFPEEVLFSDAPPRVVDFLNDNLVLRYDRPAFLKTLRIKLEDRLEPEITPGEQS